MESTGLVGSAAANGHILQEDSQQQQQQQQQDQNPRQTRMAISSILSSPPQSHDERASNAGTTTAAAAAAATTTTATTTETPASLPPLKQQLHGFAKELQAVNDPKFILEKDEYLAQLKSKLAHITTLDLLAMNASNWDFINNEQIELLSKSTSERYEVKKLLKQMLQADVVKRGEVPIKGKKPALNDSKNNNNNNNTSHSTTTANAAAAPTTTTATTTTTRKRGSKGKSSSKKDSSSSAAGSVSKSTTQNESRRRGSKKRKSSAVKEEEEGVVSLKLKFSKPQQSANHLVPIAPAGADQNGKGEDAGSKDDNKEEEDVKLELNDDLNDEDYQEPAKKRRTTSRKKNTTAEASNEAKEAKEKENREAKEAKEKLREQQLKENQEKQKQKFSAKEVKAIQKQYDNVYFTIWKDLSRKDASKIHRLVQQGNQARLVNLRKTSILCSREAKKWQLRTNKSQKDLQAKARRGMREMFNFWKRNEREERDLRKKAEREALDKSKREEEERESRRQARKLNFLITQTELYSHFIGRKIKTDEIEGTTAAENRHKDVEVPVDAKRTDFNSIDFDSENEEELKKAAAANAQSALLDAKQKAQQFNGTSEKSGELKQVSIDDDDLNFQNPTSLGDITIEQPKMLNCTLKEYQVKGLNWLANLYDQGINGILADEMGLGKTVQSISVLAYLAETHNIWGPFLVVSPASTLHNWQQEISKFVPDFKVLPYWGNGKDRKILRKFWDRKQVTYTKDSPFHVLVTSYQLVVADIQYFQRIKWQYMILDEAQAIKSSQSSRWKSLLGLQCRNRLLLTGTPIQNSMQELWALLHFIMPSLFDSHEEFSEWFSKDIESHAQSNTQLNEQQLRRLHVILKPFMLRRIKKNVQSELGEKIEIDLYCNLTNRQQKLYKMLRSQISLMDLIEKATSGSDDSNQSLINLVMQFRKVCNHPDLFERDDVKSAFSFVKFAETGSFLRESNSLDLQYSSKNLIELKLPKLIYRDLLTPTADNFLGSKNRVLNHLFNIWNTDYIHNNSGDNNAFSWLRFVDLSPNEAVKISRKSVIERAIDRRTYIPKVNQYEDFERKNLLLFSDENQKTKPYLKKIQETVYQDMYLSTLESCAPVAADAPPIELTCLTRSFVTDKQGELFNPKITQALLPLSLDTQLSLMANKVPIEQYPKAEMLPPALNDKVGYSTIRMPSMDRFISDSAKLAKLDRLLTELKANDHRVLIYFQMTKMMDLMEEYLTYRQHKYIRLDGSSKLDDRRDLVSDWQTRPEIFVFLLSTRAGGLGINLTAADTVIFYDSDWNPTIDSQAMDRAHRLGQTRQVTVYRLLVRGTIEERMRDRAKQKEHVQQVVMEGKATSQQDPVGFQKPTREVALWLLDDEQAADAVLKTKKLEEEKQAKKKANENKRNKKTNLEDMYHEGEGNFDDGTNAAANGKK